MQGYFRWVLESNEDRLTELRKEKRKILDKVMDTETYKVAKELLEKYDPSSLKPERSEVSPQRMMSPAGNQSLRFRASPVSHNTPAARHFMNTSNPNLNSTPAHNRPANQQPAQLAQYPAQMQRPNLMLPPPQRPRLSRPVLPADRSLVEKMVDFVVGDGPNNRYALICCYCHSHNGMALKDEFEYLAFKCCYCSTYNPARKTRPFAPRIAPSAQPVVEEPDSETEKSEKVDETADGSEKGLEIKETSDEKGDEVKDAVLTDDEDEKGQIVTSEETGNADRDKL